MILGIRREWATYCVLARTHAVLWAHDGVDLPVPQPDPCRQLRVPECLFKADSCGCGTEENCAVKGASWVHAWNLPASSHRLEYYINFTFLPRSRPTAQENGVLKFPYLREGDAVFDSGAECRARKIFSVILAN